MSGREFTGRTVAEAVANGLAELGLAEEEARVEVLESGARGFLGLGAKEARVVITPLVSAAKVAERWLREFLDVAGISGVVGVRTEDGALHASLEGQDMGLLIGAHGRTLDSLQYLLNLAVGKQAQTHQQVFLDICGYRKRREETIRRIARQAAEQVRRSGQPSALEPMSAAERRLVHLTLQEMKDLSTQSEGEEPYRRVVVSVKAPGRPSP